MVVGDRWAGLTISETADLLVVSSTTISRLYKERKKIFHSIEFLFFKLAWSIILTLQKEALVLIWSVNNQKECAPRINTSPLYSAHLTVWSCTGAYILVDAQLQAAILNHVNAVISVTGSEESLSLVQLDQHHVTTQLQKQRFLEVPEHPVCARHSSVTASWNNHATYQRMNMPNTDCETTDESLQWPSHSFLVYR